MKGSPLLIVVAVALIPLLIFSAIVVDLGYSLVAWQPPVLWSHEFGSGSSSATLLVSDSSGLYVQGYSFGDGSLFLEKLDSQGNTVWSRSIGSLNNSFTSDLFRGLSVGGDGIYLSGSNFSTPNGQGILLKYDFSGNKLWERNYTSIRFQSVFGTASAVYVTGDSTPLTNQSYTGAVTFIREYDSSGNVAWTTEYSNDTTSYNGVYSSSSGTYVAYYAVNRTKNLGPFITKFDQSGKQVWMRQVPLGTPSSIVSGISGDSTGVYMSGGSSIATAFVAKYGFDGTELWISSISSPDFGGLGEDPMALDSSGVYVSLDTSLSHGFLEKVDLNGHIVWSFQMQSPEQDYNFGPTAFRLSANSGKVYFAGSVKNNGVNSALVGALGPDESLVFFGLIPPWSFLALGGVFGIIAIAVIMYRRSLRNRAKPYRVPSNKNAIASSRDEKKPSFG